MLRTLPEIEALFDELFSLPRSITGAGYRQSLDILARYVPFELERTPSGSQVFDWTVPKEWDISEGYLLDPEGKRIADFHESNLSVVNYSIPVDRQLSLDELQKHLHSIPESPSWTPYVTSYYQPNWGFCLPHAVRTTLKPGSYRAVIRSSLKDGSVDYGMASLEGGTSGKLVLISSYLCHPSMANNELSGPIVLVALYERLSRWPKRRFDYLFLINPETIGSICFLHRHGSWLSAACRLGSSSHALAARVPSCPTSNPEWASLRWTCYSASWDVTADATFASSTRRKEATSASIAARLSTCRSVRSPGRRTARIPNIIPQRTTRISFAWISFPTPSLRLKTF